MSYSTTLGVRSGSNHCRRYCAKKRFAHSRLPDKSRSSYPKHRIDRRFEPRSQDGVDSLKHGRLAHIRSQFSLFRRSPTHKNLPPATFCTSEQLLFGSFCRSKKNVKTSPFRELPDKLETCPCRASTLRVLLSPRENPRGVGAPPPTCTRKACMPLAS